MSSTLLHHTKIPSSTSLTMEEVNGQLILKFTKSDSNLILPSGKIMFVSWNSSNVRAVIPKTLEQLESQITLQNKLEKEFPFQIIISYIFDENYMWIEKLANFLNSTYVKFISLDVMWYNFSVGGRKYDESIMSCPVVEKYSVNYPQINSSCELMCDLETEVTQVENGILEMEERLKEEKIMDIIVLYQKLVPQFKKYHQLLEDGIQKMETLHSKLADKDKEVGKIIPSSQVINPHHSKIVGQKKVLEVINLEIKNSSLAHQKQKKEINLLNTHVVNTEEKIKALHQELKNLQKPVVKGNLNDSSTHSNSISRKANHNHKLTPDMITHQVAVFIHLYHFSLWEEFLTMINNLSLLGIYFDVFLNLSIEADYNQSQLPKTLKQIQDSPLRDRIFITYSKNKGRDIEGFLNSYQKMISIGYSYNSIVKLHSLDNEKWRFALVYSLLGNINIIQHNLSLLQKPQVGMIGFQVKPINYKISKAVKYYLTSLKKKIDISQLEGNFIPGNIFWIRTSILKSYLTPDFVKSSMLEIQNISELPSKIDSKSEAWQRLFGLFVNQSGYLTVSYDYEE